MEPVAVPAEDGCSLIWPCSCDLPVERNESGTKLKIEKTKLGASIDITSLPILGL